MNNKKYLNIVRHYEECLAKYGDTHKGVDWPKLEDVGKRYQVMLELSFFKESPGTVIDILDFGCGASHLYEYILAKKLSMVYAGLDISEEFVRLCRRKHPNNTYYCADVLESASLPRKYDFIIMNGVFTEKRELSDLEMRDYFQRMVKVVFGLCSKGVAFNVMSKDVDWERDDLFHLPLSDLSAFLTKQVSRKFIIRNDYGLYEYTCYVYR